MIDTHAHLNDARFVKDVRQAVSRALEAGVRKIINVGFDLESSKRAVAQAENYDCVYAAVGIHPHDSGKAAEKDLDVIYEMCRHPKVVAVGEIGLDYYRNLSPKDVQKRMFELQVNLAKQADKPVIVHDREAHADTVKVLKDSNAGIVGGVLHCFSGSAEIAAECLKMGFYISFAGPVTFSNARRLAEVAASIPLDRILAETDCPYLTPEPHRGRRNEPAYVRYVVETLARIKGLSFEEMREITEKNARMLFNI